MKRILYALVVFCAVGFLSCRKSNTDISIRQFDDNQIQDYIKANNLTGMIHDPADTAGIYYQIITQGNGKVFDYSDKVPFLYSVKSFDGNYSSTDTILNHVYTYAAYIGPTGLQLTIKNILKQKGTKARILIPSRLAYGINGTTISRYTSLTTTSNATVGGNQGLDFTVTLIDDDAKVNITVTLPTKTVTQSVTKLSLYDDIGIKKFMSSKGLTGFTRVDTGKYTGLYYKITKAGTGAAIKRGSIIGVQYTGSLLNGAVFQTAVQEGLTAAATLSVYEDSLIQGMYGALINASAGADISIIMPSELGYGYAGLPSSAGFGIPPFSCIHFEMTIVTVSN